MCVCGVDAEPLEPFFVSVYYVGMFLEYTEKISAPPTFEFKEVMF
jgi:hypothetical protein